MSIAFDIAAVVISIVLLLKNYKRITLSSRYLIYFLFLFYYVIPLILDVVYMRPEYTKSLYRGFNLTRDDELTRCIYDLFVVYSQLVILNFRRWKTTPEYMDSLKVSELEEKLEIKEFTVNLFIVIGAVLPVLLTVILPVNKRALFVFQWREYGIIDYTKHFGFIEQFTYIGIICTLVLLVHAIQNRRFGAVLMYGVLLFMNICIQGKRSILFFALLVYILIMLPGLRNKALDSKERRRKMFGIVIIAVIAVGIMIASTLVVKVTSRGYDANDFSELYTALRIDFFRDDRVRMAIYAILNPNQMKIVDFPGQTLLPIPTWIFPIDHILGKFGISYPAYTSYFCSALLMLPRSQSFTYMTPCIYAELISNFGFLGALFMPFLCVWFATKADKYPYPFNVFILVSFISLQMYAISYMAYYFEFVFLMCWLVRSGKRIVIGRFGRIQE